MIAAGARGALTSNRRDLYLLGCLLLISALITTGEASNLRLCGTRLTKALLALCRGQLCAGGLGGIPVAKRAPQADADIWPMSALQGESPAIPDFLTVHKAMKRGGVATECCERRCSFAYLKTFCCDE
ncbi:unnamed protein product, partial [Mesorhabditis belari]|uniref:Insulin-like domain-containing protein n=1 Tax=Mesorhabditis belari TaxID=2138241 RepID=A0AAF3FMG5_9BILA